MLGTPVNTIVGQVDKYYNAIDLIEKEDTDVRRAKIYDKLDFKTVFKLGRFKEAMESTIKLLKLKKAEANEAARIKDENGVVIGMDQEIYNKMVNDYLSLEDTIFVPTFNVSEFLDKTKKDDKKDSISFVVPIKFISAFSSILKDDKNIMDSEEKIKEILEDFKATKKEETPEPVE